MNITSKVIMVNFTNEITVGDKGAITATVEHQATIYKDKDGEIAMEVDYIDIRDIKFLDIAVEGGYQGYKKFIANMKEMGLNIEELIEDAAANVAASETESLAKLVETYKPLMQ